MKDNRRRGAVVLIQSGDAEIAGAIARGIMAARGTLAEPPTAEQVEIVEAEIDRQHIQASLLRVAVGNTRTAEDYRHMLTKARGDYATRRRQITPARRLGGAILKAWALLCYGVALAYHSQERVLR